MLQNLAVVTEPFEIKYVDGSWAVDFVGEIEDGVEDDGLMQSAG